MTYDQLRHLADSYGLIFMGCVFLLFVVWTFRRGAAGHHERASTMIFREEDRSNG